LIAASDVGSGPAVVSVGALDAWDANGLKAIATHIVAQANAAVALFSTASPHPVVMARSPGMSLDVTAVLRELVASFGGRGGGKADLAQGGGLVGNLSEIMRAARQLLERGPLSLS
ncbi:MAG TPA: DHHA1 domain-containing protein, partial [Vicinamibacterales bacterium]|nr:DHHA1 domain-containing protein [Vicinamibacterales bacterium]